MKGFFVGVVFIFFCFSVGANEPSLLSSDPTDGAFNIPIDKKVISLHFNQNMKMNSQTLWVDFNKGKFPPLADGENTRWIDPKTFEIQIANLEPNTQYYIQLNSESRGGFRSAQDNTPLPITGITFTTGSNGGTSMASSNSKSKGFFLELYKEQYQGAFYILIPKGWKTEGGMIPSGTGWNVVDLVENNIQFRVTSPDGKSFFGWYPRFYFQDPAVFTQSSMGMLNPQMGQVLNGCWIYPYMGVKDYVEYIVFQQFAQNEFLNPRIIGNAIPAPELEPWAPKSASRYEYGYVNFECTVNGTPSFGRMYSINYDLGGMIWSTVGTFGLVSPKDQWDEMEPLMERCIRSFKLDPQWAAKASKAAAQRGEQFYQTVKGINEAYNEMQQQRSQTRSDIQEEMYKVLTDQIETKDPETGGKTWLPSYNNAYTDGQGNYYLSDTEGPLPVENPTEWRKLEIINKNDLNYRPED